MLEASRGWRDILGSLDISLEPVDTPPDVFPLLNNGQASDLLCALHDRVVQLGHSLQRLESLLPFGSARRNIALCIMLCGGLPLGRARGAGLLALQLLLRGLGVDGFDDRSGGRSFHRVDEQEVSLDTEGKKQEENILVDESGRG